MLRKNWFINSGNLVHIGSFIMLIGCASNAAKNPEPNIASLQTNNPPDYADEIREGNFAFVTEKSGAILRLEPNVKSRKLHLIKYGEPVRVVNVGGPPPSIEELNTRWFQINYGDWQGWVFGTDLSNEQPVPKDVRFRKQDGCFQPSLDQLPKAAELTCLGECNGCERISIYNDSKITFRHGCHYEGAWDGTWRIANKKLIISGTAIASGSIYYYSECGGSEEMEKCMGRADKKFVRTYGKKRIEYKMIGSLTFNDKAEAVLDLTVKEDTSIKGYKRYPGPKSYRSHNLGCLKRIPNY